MKLSKILRIIGLIIGLIGIGLIFANYNKLVLGLCLIIIAFVFMCFSLKMKMMEIKKN